MDWCCKNCEGFYPNGGDTVHPIGPCLMSGCGHENIVHGGDFGKCFWFVAKLPDEEQGES